jgi:hypothetical protein
VVDIAQQLADGRRVDLRVGDPVIDDPSRADAWDTDRAIAAEILIELLTAAPGPEGRRRRLDLAGARITGVVDLNAAILTRGLRLTGCTFDNPVELSEADVLAWAMPGCHVPAVNAERMNARGPVELNDGFSCTGEVDLQASSLFELNCEGARLRNPGGRALDLYNAFVERGVYLDYGFQAAGRVSLHGARIGGPFDCSAGTFRNPGGEALTGYALTVGEFLYCNEGFSAEGQVTLTGARIGGSLVCSDGTFSNPGGVALAGNQLTVGHTIYLDQGFTADGEVELTGLRLAASLVCSDGNFRNPPAVALNLRHARVEDAVVMLPATFEGALDLTSCKVDLWSDDRRTWPTRANLRGFDYGALVTAVPVAVEQRLGWLDRDPDGYHPQPYEQLAAGYRREGDGNAARTVLIAKQRRRRRPANRSWRGWPGAFWSALLRVTIGYGYRPWRAGWLALLLLVSGSLLFDQDHQDGLLSPRGDITPRPEFDPFRYTLDLLIPIAGLGERELVVPLGAAAWHTFAFVLMGWLVAAALVAGASGIFKRD